MTDSRARLTIPDIVEVAVALAFFGGLSSVFFAGLDDAAQYLSAGEAYAWQLIPPLMALVLLAVVLRKATAGGGA